MMLTLGIALLCGATFTLSWLLIGGPVLSRGRARARLQHGFDEESDGNGLVVNIRRGGFTTLANGLYPTQARGYLEALVVAAGRPAAWPLERVVAAKLVLLGVAGVLGFLLAWRVRTPLGWGVAVFLVLLGFFLPDLRLWSVGIERRRAISLQLPETLDQMSIAVRAGLGFDAAMVRVARNSRGELAAELVRAMQDIQLGHPRRIAYSELSERCGVPELRRFMRAVIQAETYGLALAEVLHTQADEMRIQRRQRAEYKAMQIPVKVVFPLILCIMPALFVVLVGPAGIRIAQAFGLVAGG